MRISFFIAISLTLALPLGAWSPRFHEAQARTALGMIPVPMRRFLESHPQALLDGARGIPSDEVPTVEDVEIQFQRVIRFSEDRRHPETLVRELGVLAHLVQLLADPSAIRGVTPLRDHFETYGDEQLPHLLVTNEPNWGLRSSFDPREPLLDMAKTKFQRHAILANHFDETTRQRIGSWDQRSLPFAELQLAFSEGVNATANLWILSWRAVGDLWTMQESRGDLGF